MECVRSWLYFHEELPISVRRRIQHHFQKHLTQKSATEDAAIMNDLSPALVQDVSLFLVPQVVRCNVLFHNLSSALLAQIMNIVQPREVERDETIVEQGESGDTMYIITIGSARFVH